MYRVFFFIIWFELVIAGSADEVSDFQRRKFATFLSVINGINDGVLEESDFHAAMDRYINSCSWKLNETKVVEMHDIHATKGWEAFAYDKKGEGKSVTRDEYFAVMPMRVKDPKYRDSIKNLGKWSFSALDVDYDNLVNLVEYSAMLHQTRGVDSSKTKLYFDGIDSNHDNVITFDEFQAAFIEFMVGEDENHPSKWFFGPLD